MVIDNNRAYYDGFITFYLGSKGLESKIEPIEKTEFYKLLKSCMVDECEEFQSAIHNQFSANVYHLISGKEFLDYVNSGCLIDYDGEINCIYVDGYKSNLGLICGGLSSGKFLVNEVVFKSLLKKYDIKVDWVNK